MDVIGRINVTRDNGAGGPLLRIFFKKRKFKLLTISYLLRSESTYLNRLNADDFCKRFLLNLMNFYILRQVHVI